MCIILIRCGFPKGFAGFRNCSSAGMQGLIRVVFCMFVGSVLLLCSVTETLVLTKLPICPGVNTKTVHK